MSEAEREAFRARMRERFGSRPPVIDRQEQLEAIKIMEEQLAKLKTAMEATSPENRERFRDLPAEERSAFREKIMAAMRQRMRAVRTMEEELEKLKGPRLPEPDPRERIEELRAIQELAVKENASETAKRLEGLIASFERESRRGRWRPEPRPRGDIQRPRPDRPPRGDSGERAKPFTLNSFNGKTVSLGDYRGKTVVLEWLNYECPFSRYHYDTEHTMIDLAKKYKNQDVVWLAINSTSHSTPEKNKEFAAKHNLPYPILDDRAGTVGRAYGAKTTPHLFIISPRGQIVYNGAIDNSPMGKTPEGKEKMNYVDKVLAALVANRDIDVRETKSYGCSVKYAQ
jgi:peroxiredoxin